jgi:hypothetical protein
MNMSGRSEWNGAPAAANRRPGLDGWASQRSVEAATPLRKRSAERDDDRPGPTVDADRVGPSQLDPGSGIEFSAAHTRGGPTFARSRTRIRATTEAAMGLGQTLPCRTGRARSWGDIPQSRIRRT